MLLNLISPPPSRPDSPLSDRGISPDTAATFQINFSRYRGQPGYGYPATDPIHNKQVNRWKNADSSGKPKYAWPNGGSVKYYAHPTLAEQVRRANGVIYLAAGEIDLWTYHSAGIPNVFSFYGEGNAPRSLADDLKRIGVTCVIYLPDRDEAGRRSAAKVRDRLRGTGIHFEARQLPAVLGEKGDTNDLWQHTDCNPALFRQVIDVCPPLELPAPTPQKRTRTWRPTSAVDASNPYNQWVRDIVKPALDSAAPVVRGQRADGFRHSPDPTREDRSPSFRVSYDVNQDIGIPMDAFGAVEGGWNTVAEWLGVDSFRTWIQNQAFTRNPSASSAANHRDPMADYLGKTDDFTPPPPITADLTVHEQWFSDVLDWVPDGRSVIGKSGTGTGKTTAVRSIVQAADRAIVFTTRVALGRNTAEKYGIATSNDFGADTDRSNSEIRRESHIVCTLNKAHYLLGRDGAVPKGVVVILDEVTGYIEHLAGSTFADGDGARNLSILEQLIYYADRVYALDAEMDSLTQDWLLSLRDDWFTIENTYQRNRDAKLLMYNNGGELIHRALLSAESANLPVALATDSRQLCRQVARLARQRQLRVLSVNSNTRYMEDVRAFLVDPNKHAASYDLIVYSPTLASGVDITVPFAAVYAHISGQVIAAPACHQLIDRIRHTAETHVYIRQNGSGRPTNPDEIYERERLRALNTSRVCGFNQHGVIDFHAGHAHLERLRAGVEAQNNHSLNHLRYHFKQTAVGYTKIEWVETENKRMQKTLKGIGDQIDYEDKHRTLHAEPIGPTMYRRAVENETADEDIRAGFLRWQIEQATGQPITSELYDAFHQASDRAALYTLTDVLHAEPDELKRHDISEAAHDLHRRQHRFVRTVIARDFLASLFPNGLNSTEALTEDDINERLKFWHAQHESNLRLYYNRRSDNSDRLIFVARWMLHRLGLRLNSEQRRNAKRDGGDGSHQQIYSLDAERLAFMVELADSCRARQVASVSEAVKNTYTTVGTLTHHQRKPR